MSRLESRTITSIAEFLVLKEPWDALVATIEYPEICFSHDWIRIWLECSLEHAPLRIVVFFDGDCLVGAVPLCEVPTVIGRFFSFTSLSTLTYQDMPAAGVIVSARWAREVFSALRIYFITQCLGYREMMLEHVPFEAGAVAAMEDVFNAGDVSFRREDWKGSTMVAVQGTFDMYLKSLNKSFRKSLKGSFSKAKVVGGCTSEVLSTMDRATYETFLNLEDTGWKHERGLLLKASSSKKEFLFRVAMAFQAQDAFRLFVFSIEGKPVAMELCFLFHGTCFKMNIAVDYNNPHCRALSFGNIVFYNVIKYCFDLGLKRVDFCGQFYSYQTHWSKVTTNKQQIYVYHKQDIMMHARFWVKDFLTRCGRKNDGTW